MFFYYQLINEIILYVFAAYLLRAVWQILNNNTATTAGRTIGEKLLNTAVQNTPDFVARVLDYIADGYEQYDGR